MSFNDYIYWQTLQETGKTPEEIYEYEHPKVVRCKECVKRMREDCPMCNGCKLDRIPTEDDDFCSYGEAKEDE